MKSSLSIVKLQTCGWQSALAACQYELVFRWIKKISFLCLILSLLTQSGCALLNKKDVRLSGDGVTTHSLAGDQIELRMKISGLTSNLWITAEVFNHSGQVVMFQTADLIEFESPECFEVRDRVNNVATPLQPQQFEQFRFSYFWKGRRKSDPLYQICLEKPMRFTLRGIEISRELVKAPSWTIQP